MVESALMDPSKDADDKPRFLHRFCSAARALSILRAKSLYLAPPCSLNDPFEFKGMVDFECSQNDRKVILDLAARHELGLSEDQIRETERQRDSMAESDFYVYLLSWRIRGVLGFLYQFSGVCCFTRHCDNRLLWSHYADAHSGACLVFNNLDGTCPIFEDVMPVIYTDTVPKLRLLDFYTNREQFSLDNYKLFHTKQTAWSYEREWRVVLPSKRPLADEERLIPFEEQHLCKVILGDRISPQSRDAIRAMSAGRNFPLLVYQARVLDGNYGLRFKLLPPDLDYPDHSAWHKVPGSANEWPFPFSADPDPK